MESVGGCVVFKEMCVYVCVEGSISSSVLGCLMYLSPIGLWLSISIVRWKGLVGLSRAGIPKEVC